MRARGTSPGRAFVIINLNYNTYKSKISLTQKNYNKIKHLIR